MTSAMPKILLQDYVNPRKRYALDADAGSVAQDSFKNASDASANTAGYGAYCTIGLLRGRRRVFVAAYTDETTWLVRIENRVFDFADTSLRVRRDAKVFFVKRFAISRGAETLLSLEYFYIDHQVWLDNGDILSFIERTASTPDAHEGFAYIWRAKKQGRDIASKAFINELDQWRRSRRKNA